MHAYRTNAVHTQEMLYKKPVLVVDLHKKRERLSHFLAQVFFYCTSFLSVIYRGDAFCSCACQLRDTFGSFFIESQCLINACAKFISSRRKIYPQKKDRDKKLRPGCTNLN